MVNSQTETQKYDVWILEGADGVLGSSTNGKWISKLVASNVMYLHFTTRMPCVSRSLKS